MQANSKYKSHTRIKWLAKADHFLCQKMPWYNSWHHNKHVHKAHIVALIIFIASAVMSVAYFSYMTKISLTFAANKTWTGAGTDETCGGNVGDGFKFSCGANWNLGTVPVNGDTITFNSTSVKNAVLDADFNAFILTFTIANTYTGIVTLENELNVTGAFSQAGNNTFNAQNQSININGAFSVNASSNFTAPSTNLSLGAAMTIHADATFNHNSGTVVFDGASTQSINCNSNNLNTVSFTTAVGTKTITNCSFSLGDNPIVNANITLSNSTINGTGVFTMGDAIAKNFTFNAGSALVGFSEYDFNGIFTLGADATFEAPPLMSIASTLSIHADATFNHNNGTVVFDGASQNLLCNNAEFNLVVLGGSGTKTIRSSCTMPLGNNPEVTTTISLDGGEILGSGTLSLGSIFNIYPDSKILGFSGIKSTNSFRNYGAVLDLSYLDSFVLDGAWSSLFNRVDTGELTFPEGAQIDGRVYLEQGTLNFGNNTHFNNLISIESADAVFNAPAGTMYISQDFSAQPGTASAFKHNGGVVVLSGDGGTLACNGVVFNVVAFANSGTKQIDDTCSLPVGSNPNLAGTGRVFLRGELVGSGTITKEFGEFMVQGDNAKLTGFNKYSFANFNVNNTLIGHWTFDEGEGDIANDSSINGNNGFLVDEPVWVDGKFGKALQFDGVDDAVEVPDHPTLDVSGDITVSAWVNAPKDTTRNFLSKYYPGEEAGWLLAVSNNNQVSFRGRANCGVYQRADSDLDAISGDQWHHIVGVRDNGVWKVYVDGVHSGTTGHCGGSMATSTSLFIGRLLSPIAFYQGIVDDVRIYAEALSDQNIAILSGENPVNIEGNFSLDASLDVGNDVTILNANLYGAGNPIDLVGNWINVGGDFVHGNSTVSLVGTNQNIFGNNIFYNLFKTNSGILTFENNSTTTIENELKLVGAKDNLLTLKSSIDDDQWIINPQGTSTVSYVDTKDSNNISSETIIALQSTNSGNNNNWSFPVDEEPTNPDGDEDEEEDKDDDKDDDEDDSSKDDTDSDKATDTKDKDDAKDDEKVATQDPETEKPTVETPTSETPQQISKDDQTVIEEKVASAQSVKDSVLYFILFILLLALITWVIMQEHKVYNKE